MRARPLRRIPSRPLPHQIPNQNHPHRRLLSTDRHRSPRRRRRLLNRRLLTNRRPNPPPRRQLPNNRPPPPSGGLVDELLASPSQVLINPGEQVSGLATHPLQLADGLLGGLLEGGKAPSPADAPSAPVAPAPPTPVPPLSSPMGNSLSGLGSSGGVSFLLLGVLAFFSILLLERRFSWPSCELLKPNSALRPAIERPG